MTKFLFQKSNRTRFEERDEPLFDDDEYPHQPFVSRSRWRSAIFSGFMKFMLCFVAGLVGGYLLLWLIEVIRTG